jgi:hypothetical protein
VTAEIENRKLLARRRPVLFTNNSVEYLTMEYFASIFQGGPLEEQTRSTLGKTKLPVREFFEKKF